MRQNIHVLYYLHTASVHTIQGSTSLPFALLEERLLHSSRLSCRSSPILHFVPKSDQTIQLSYLDLGQERRYSEDMSWPADLLELR